MAFRETLLNKLHIVIYRCITCRPGFARINLPYFMDDETVHFVLEAVDMVATHGWKLLPQVKKNNT